MTREETDRAWSELEKLEDKAHGAFAGGLYLSVDRDALSKEQRTLPEADPEAVETLLDALEVPKSRTRRADSPDAMKREMSAFFTKHSEMAKLAARGFEELSDEAAKSIYEEFIELQEKAKGSG